jgi:organic radical activating enzyme
LHFKLQECYQKKYRKLTKAQCSINGRVLYLFKEKVFMGTAAYFVRIGGCDVGCHWCDERKKCRIASLKHQSDCIQCKKYSETVVVTGGAIDVGYDPLTQTLKKMDEKFILKPLELIR